MSMIEIAEENFDSYLKNNFFIAEFGFSWCGSCSEVKHIIESKIMPNFPDIVFGHIDVGNNINIKHDLNITKFPTVIIYMNGVEKQRVVELKKMRNEKIYKIICDSLDMAYNQSTGNQG